MPTFSTKFFLYKKRVNSYLADFLNQNHHDFHPQAEPQSLYDPMRYALEGNGKRIRPILLLLCCEALGGSFEKALPAAAAVELMHNFTLVHDDIMDCDDTRRGRPTVHRKWNTDTAILAGDGLVVMAYRSLLATNTQAIKKICQVFTEGIIQICEGQAFDREFEQDESVKMEEYENMILKKTAKLLSICSHIGAILGNGLQHQIEILRSFAENIGMAFQIQDDILDITTEQKTLGKDFGSDVKRKKRTFLCVYAMEHGSINQRKSLKDIFNQSSISDTDVLAVQKIFHLSGALNAAKDQVYGYLKMANLNLEQLKPNVQTADLSALTYMILHRNA